MSEVETRDSPTWLPFVYVFHMRICWHSCFLSLSHNTGLCSLAPEANLPTLVTVFLIGFRNRNGRT